MTVAAGTASLWGSMRARLTMLAAGVFGLALVAGGTLWVWGVGVRMLDSQKTADLERAALEATFRAGGPMGRMGFPGRRGRRMPPVDPFRDAYVVAISADGSVTSTRDDDDVSEDALNWIRQHIADRDLDAASLALGERIDEWSRELASCMRERRGGGRFRGRRGEMMGEPGNFPDREGQKDAWAAAPPGSPRVPARQSRLIQTLLREQVTTVPPPRGLTS